MLALIPILALSVGNPADQALDRMQKYYLGAKTLDTELVLSSGRTKARAKLRWSRLASQAFEIQIGADRYVYRQNPQGVLEVEHSSKRYASFSARDSLVPPPGEVDSAGPSWYPSLLLDRSPTLGAIRGNPNRSHAKGTVGGKPVDQVAARFTSPVSSSTYELSIDASGRLVRLRRTVQDRVSKFESVYDFVTTRRNTPLQASLFSTTIPSGYSPERLPEMPSPSPSGSPLPSVSCVNLGTGRSLQPKTLLGKGGLLILVSEHGSPISDRMASLLAQVAPAAKAKSIPLVEVDVSALKPPAAAVRPGFSARLWDSTGRFRKAVRVPGTPMALLYGKDALLRQAWMGITPAEQGTIEQEMIEALVESASQP